MTHAVRIVGWTPGVQVVSLVQEIRPYVGSLASAKELVDGLLAGQEITIETPDIASADRLRERVRDLGGIATIS